MSWNYRIVEYPTGGYGLHEVFYDEAGNPKSMTKREVGFCGDTVDEVKAAMDLALEAFRKPIFVEPKEWSE